MNKIRLNLDDLIVDAFATDSVGDGEPGAMAAYTLNDPTLSSADCQGSDPDFDCCYTTTGSGDPACNGSGPADPACQPYETNPTHDPMTCCTY